jgi:DNA polymerase-3 subunit alpha
VAQDSVDGGVKCLFETSYLRRGKQKVSWNHWSNTRALILKLLNSAGPGYFLIVQDLIAEARSMGVSVGPGRICGGISVLKK